MFKKGFFFLFLLFIPAMLNAQALVSLKLVNLENKEVVPLGDFERGKIWVTKHSKKVLLYNGDSLKAFSVKSDVFFPIGDIYFKDKFDVLNWQNVENDVIQKEAINKRLIPQFLWSSALKNISVSIATTDVNGEKLFIADTDGDIHVFDIKSKEYEGKLRFLKKPIKFIKTLKNRGLVIVYEGNIVYYIQYFKIPFFSFLQDLKSSYVEKNRVKVPLNFISSFSINESENKILMSGDHKTIILLQLPSLSYSKITEERLFIEFADFLGDDSVIYMTLKERGYIESNVNIRSHFNFMKNFFDLRKEVVVSPSGNFIARFSEQESFDIFELNNTPRQLASVNIEKKMFGELFWGGDNRTFIFTDKNREKITLFRLIEEK